MSATAFPIKQFVNFVELEIEKTHIPSLTNYLFEVFK